MQVGYRTLCFLYKLIKVLTPYGMNLIKMTVQSNPCPGCLCNYFYCTTMNYMSEIISFPFIINNITLFAARNRFQKTCLFSMAVQCIYTVRIDFCHYVNLSLIITYGSLPQPTDHTLCMDNFCYNARDITVSKIQQATLTNTLKNCHPLSFKKYFQA